MTRRVDVDAVCLDLERVRTVLELVASHPDIACSQFETALDIALDLLDGIPARHFSEDAREDTPTGYRPGDIHPGESTTSDPGSNP